MISRRSFLTYAGTGTLTLFMVEAGGAPIAVAAGIPGGTLAADTIPAFVAPLLIPSVMPTKNQPMWRGRRIDYYEISVQQLAQQMLPPGLPTTTVWGFGPAGDDRNHSAPSQTIEASAGVPVRIKWVNALVDKDDRYLPHLLPVDPTLHWANPEQVPGPDGLPGTDLRPDFTGRAYVPPAAFTDPATQYTAYRGPVPFVAHLHGAVHVGDESDGYSESWYLPAARNLPAGFARNGRWYPFFATKSKGLFGQSWTPGSAVAQYPNDNRASTLWFHDHTLGMTRLNVYAGPAGFYIVRGGPAGDNAVLDRRTGKKAVLPGPAPRAGDKAGKAYGELALAIQDRSFNADGSLFYPDSRAFFDGYAGPYLPEVDVSPIWNPEFFGNTLITNGRVWPYVDVTQRRYRLRLLNGCQARFVVLDFAGIPGVKVHQLGNDGGFLGAVHDVMALDGGRLLLGPAERADVIVDFTAVTPGNYVLGNVGPDEPYGGGEPGLDFAPADPATTGRVLQFRVAAATGLDPSTPAEFLVLPALTPLPAARRTRRVALLEHSHQLGDGEGPTAAMLGILTGDPTLAPVLPTHAMWADRITENPAPGDTETWEIHNLTVDAHPIHLHEVAFEVVDRQPCLVEEGRVSVDPAAPRTGPRPGETGFKDTVVAEPGQVTRIKATFGTPGQYVWHCHIVEHEDNEMMRPYRIGPPQPGQPG